MQLPYKLQSKFLPDFIYQIPIFVYLFLEKVYFASLRRKVMVSSKK
jgi:hypothetical protein